MVGPLSHSYAAAGFFPKSTDPKHAEIDKTASSIVEEAEYDVGGEAGPECEVQAEPRTTCIRQEGQNSNDHNNYNTYNADQEEQEESVYEQSKYWLIEDSNVSKLNKQFLRCTQTLNLRNNFLYWDAKSKEKQNQLQQQTSISSSSRKQSLVEANNNSEKQTTEKEP